MVHESPSHLLHMRRRQRQDDERLLLADKDTPKFERTVVAQPPQLPSAAKAVTWTQPEMGSQEKSSPIHGYGDRQVVRPIYAPDRDDQSKQKSSEVFVIDLNTIDRIGDLDAASEGRPLSDADIHLSTRKARILERCKRREEQRRQHRRAVTAGAAGTARGEENGKVTAKQRRQKRADISQAHINKKAGSAADVCSPTPSTARRVSPASSTPSHQASAKEQPLPSTGPVSSSRRPASCNHTPLSDPPRLYVQPQTKSNRRVITNALIHCCLAGRVNEQLKVNILQVIHPLPRVPYCEPETDLGRTDGQHFIILLRGGCQFSGLFRLEPGSEEMVRVGGTGPHRITSSMIERFYKCVLMKCTFQLTFTYTILILVYILLHLLC
ncbi:unnamed protein product [Dibothriocephalus latus]|uniref:CKK domain-containing protein n=1 Tax=Dibothriocephalus latus TaxID=60516 RepID=A0A3P7LFI2_DIBLA|nr:unnamed protein product [Dibothriocephalus latus]